MPAEPFSEGTGIVDTFDEDRGLGTVRADGGEVLAFHCTAIADGSRRIPEGQPVRFLVVAGRSGHWEAARIVAL
jgi:cold shock CspA family protein